jgi:hypothetical protein
LTGLSEDRVFARHRRRTGAVLIIGVGAVGGLLAGKLAKLGISPLSLVDCDTLDVENLVRHPLGAEDLGKPKASALASRINRDFPVCDARGLNVDFLRLPVGKQRDLMRDVSVVVGATDSPECQRRINEVSLATETVAVYPGIWSGDHVGEAEVGEIFWVLPGRHSPCYLCATSWRNADVRAEARGGTGADVELLVLATLWVVAGLLDPHDPRAAILDHERTHILVHGLMPHSPSVQEIFSSSNLRNVRVPFPRQPCPACGGQALPSPREGSQPTPPLQSPPKPNPPPARNLSVGDIIGIALGLLVIIGVGLIFLTLLIAWIKSGFIT